MGLCRFKKGKTDTKCPLGCRLSLVGCFSSDHDEEELVEAKYEESEELVEEMEDIAELQVQLQ